MGVREALARARARQKLSPFERCGCRKPDPLAGILALSEAEMEGWRSQLDAIWRTGTPMNGGWPGVLPPGASQGTVPMSKDAAGNLQWSSPVNIGTIDDVGDSHISEFGPTGADFGIAQKVAQMFGAQLRSCALGGQLQAWGDQGNAALGDGGWAHIATEFDRQEQSGTKGATTSSGAYAAPNMPVNARDNFVAGEFVVWGSVGTPANTEIVQISSAYVPATGAGNIALAAAPAHAHVAGDPVYHALKNEGQLAKSQVVLMAAEGLNDLGYLGPGAPPTPLSNNWQSGTFGTTIGASRGLTPFMHSLRFSIANLRCSVIYKDTHPINQFGANWSSFPVTSAASYPTIYSLGGGNAGNFHYTTTAGGGASAITFSTGPDYTGAPICVFTISGNAGQGAVWDYSVAGATTRALSSNAAGSVYDDRNNGVVMNASSASGTITGSCFRITGLNAGVNTITIQPTTITTQPAFLGWGIEAPSPPLIIAIASSRIPKPAWPNYAARTVGAITATVTAGHGAAPSEVAFAGGTLALATAGTPSATLAQVNDTITLDKGVAGVEETRRIIGYTGGPNATSCQVDANFVNAHTAVAPVIGYQDADIVGGGYFNTADVQGAASVPGLAAVIASVCAEFDANVVALPVDLAVNTRSTVNSLNFYNDGIHYNDQGSELIAGLVAQTLLTKLPSIPAIASPTVPNKRTFSGVYGDASPPATASPLVTSFTAASGWTNVFSSTFPNATTYARCGYYKDARTREVDVGGAALGNVGTGTVLFTLPVHHRPNGIRPLAAYSLTTGGVYSPAIVFANALGQVICASTIVATSALVFGGSFLAGG